MFLFEIGHTINMHHEHSDDNTQDEIFADYLFFFTVWYLVMEIKVWC